jgi:hypothetical protein
MLYPNGQMSTHTPSGGSSIKAEGIRAMRVHVVVLAVGVLFALPSQLPAQSTCSGRVTGPGGKTLPAAHASLLTPNRSAVSQSAHAAKNGTFVLTIPHPGYWVLRFSGVGYANQDVALYVPDTNEIRLNVALGSYDYLTGQPALSVIGDFNLWKIPSAVPLKMGGHGVFTADIPATTDSIAFRIRGYRDGDGVEGIEDAAFVLNREGSYDARIKAAGGVARVIVDTRLLDRSGASCKVTFTHATEETRKIALAVKEWWDQEHAYFSNQMAEAMERKPLHKVPMDWGSFTAKLLRQEERERDLLVRPVRSLAYVSAALKARTKNSGSITRAMEHIPPTSPVWLLEPIALSTAVRVATWSDSVREKYIQTMIEHNLDRHARLAVLCNEFMIALDTDKDAKAARYYDLLAAEFAETPEAQEILKKYKRPDPSAGPE